MSILKYPLHLSSAFLLIIFFIACAESDESTGPDGDNGQNGSYQVVEAFPELSFARPVDLQHPGDGSNRLFVVEQRGVISVFENDASVSSKTTFLDIEDQVEDRGNEEGLLGLAFHPDFANNGYFYVNYTASNPDVTIVSRFQVSSDNPNEADPNSEVGILSFSQPYSNHNGGQVSFGPDGYLYIAVGDGGSGGDPQENGQNRSTLLGNILRIDVDNQSDGNNYAIPSDNPFAGNDQGYREEIYAYGLRNPWRFSFDANNGQLWTGDVGQNAYEEIDVVENGGNYGWNTMEGNHCFDPSSGCDQSGLELPIIDYSQSNGDRSVTGGFVYRGPTLSELEGMYIYADYVSGRIWALDFSDMGNPVNSLLLRADFGISSFGVDQDNELYICGFDGKIHKLEQES
ncbi:PQQ-dependent sugar dehydrogenase [Aliifodinibius sp. S!AR15-10]|uniref:PQQ-dependent sugar dehydrogenase n=1 Tax=Aliifodinibius sp. S!AR15-10 TaxID=2950437 RepID=UPI002855C533|nr:PQQ-dependent sugar dehydrogenase [Aliifodinibius sp. S!AR15-10]MDR8390651.1 PQQ-dependent sugar dehydrogenase [Aliifodinibius sp. S!AR15-10]